MLIAISIIAAPLPVYSQDINGGTYMEGLMQGQMMAEGNAGWILGGFCCCIFGIGGAYLIEPSPPMHMLMGKSTEYVMGFTQGYKDESKKKNTQYAAVGCLANILFFLLSIG